MTPRYAAGMRARDLMKPEPLTIPANMRFLDIQHLLVEAQIGGAPVVDDAGAIIGIVAASDLLRALDQALDEDIDEDLAHHPATTDDAPDVDLPEGLSTATARDLATPEVIWVDPDDDAAVVAARMRTEAVHRVLVGRDGALAGILTAFDLLRAIR